MHDSAKLRIFGLTSSGLYAAFQGHFLVRKLRAGTGSTSICYEFTSSRLRICLRFQGPSTGRRLYISRPIWQLGLPDWAGNLTQSGNPGSETTSYVLPGMHHYYWFPIPCEASIGRKPWLRLPGGNVHAVCPTCKQMSSTHTRVHRVYIYQ